jgi:predicted nucleotidyltransferase component of viral defense system
MISKEYIQAWKSVAPWSTDSQVEQDLIISRALCELYKEPEVKSALAFRGGTSLQKIFLAEPSRYSEDIDLVQIPKEPIGKTVDLVRSKLDVWLGKPQVAFKTGRVTLRYRYDSTETPVKKMKLKIEINNAEHFSVFGHKEKHFEMQSEWFSGECEITTFSIEEIMGTKLRALYQRKKGRDLFDFAVAFKEFPKMSYKEVVQCFLKYMEYGGHKVSRAEFEMAIHEKREDPVFTSDIAPLVHVESESFDAQTAFTDVEKYLISLLPGESWKKPIKVKEKKKVIR